MDAQRFDQMAKAVGRGATRRQALRRAGGGLAGAQLAAAGLGNRAGAQGKPTFSNCHSGGGGIIGDQGEEEFESLPCGGNEDCPRDKVCVALLNPGNRIVCRCIELT